MLAVVINDELGSIGVRLKAQLFGNETKLDIRFITIKWLALDLSTSTLEVQG